MKIVSFPQLALLASLSCVANPSTAAGTVIFRDDFNSSQLDTTQWAVGNWKLGRTQLGNVPDVAGGLAQLRFDTYRLTGTEIYTRTAFARGNGIEFEARVRMNYLPSGLVTALFTYTAQAGLSDEIDLDGVLVLQSTLAQPDLASPFRLNFWAPASSWTSAYDGSLKAARNTKQNRSYYVDVDWVEIRALP